MVGTLRKNYRAQGVMNKMPYCPDPLCILDFYHEHDEGGVR